MTQPFTQTNENSSPMIYKEHNEIIYAICFIDNNKFATAAGDYLIKIWDVDLGCSLGSLKGHLAEVTGLKSYSLSLRRILVSCSIDRTIRFWDLTNFKCFSIISTSHPKGIRCLELLEDHNLLAAGSEDKTISIWSIKG